MKTKENLQHPIMPFITHVAYFEATRNNLLSERDTIIDTALQIAHELALLDKPLAPSTPQGSKDCWRIARTSVRKAIREIRLLPRLDQNTFSAMDRVESADIIRQPQSPASLKALSFSLDNILDSQLDPREALIHKETVLENKQRVAHIVGSVPSEPLLKITARIVRQNSRKVSRDPQVRADFRLTETQVFEEVIRTSPGQLAEEVAAQENSTPSNVKQACWRAKKALLEITKKVAVLVLVGSLTVAAGLHLWRCHRPAQSCSGQTGPLLSTQTVLLCSGQTAPLRSGQT